MDFNQYINNAVSDIDNEISDLQQQRKEILSINESTIFTDKEFQHICRTQLRSSNILSIFIKNIFPDAVDIKVGPNWIRFTLDTFKCYIPTYDDYGVFVDLLEFNVNRSKPERKFFYTREYLALEHFMNATSWKEKSKAITYTKYYRTWVLFLYWIFKLKRNQNYYIEKYNELSKEVDNQYNEALTKYNKAIKDINNRKLYFKNTVYPKLKKFTDKINPYSVDTISSLTMDELQTFIDFCSEKGTN